MEAMLKILMVEDLFSDAELIKHQIKKSGIQFTDLIVDKKESYILALQEFRPDIILSDYSLPSFSGLQALQIREELAPAIPFILVTGTINEETAVEVMKAGADDYIIKEHIVRIAPAIKQAIEKKLIDKKVKLLAHSLESITECVSVTDTNDQIVYTNDSFNKTYGYEEEEVIGQNINILFDSEKTKDQSLNFKQETTKGNFREEIMNKRKDGTLFPVLRSISSIKDKNNNPIAHVAVSMDITEMIRNRDELMRAKAKAEETNRLKSAILNNMSHEIRTPMNAIMGFSSLMAEASETEKIEYAEIILKSSKQLLSVIDEVILLSRLQSEKMAVNNAGFSPAESIKDVYSMFSFRDLKKGIDLIMSLPEQYKDITILSDGNKIRQILTNLVSNAIKFTEKGVVELGFDLHEGNVEYYVKDTGTGIPEKEQRKVFDTFYRGEHAISSAIGGTGLGLSISKELVELLGGTIGVSSEPGKGSRFYFTIPVRDPEQPPANKHVQKPAPKQINDLAILVVDDEVVNCEYLEILLKGKVKKVDRAFNGKTAVDLAQKNQYNLILMDIRMPVMGGIDATKILKAQYPNLKIVAQTAFTLPEEAASVLAAGCDDILCKPIKRDQLMDMIHKYC